MSLLITRPRHDNATNYLYHWSESLIKEAKRRNLSAVIVIDRDRVNKKIIEGYLKKVQPKIAIFNGHGDSSSMLGHDDKPLISADDNEDLLSGSNVFMRACDTAKILGLKIKAAGARNFIGYSEPFMFPTNNLSKPLDDNLARDCLECSNQVGHSLIKSKSAQEAHTDSLAMYNSRVAKLQNSKSSDASVIVACLLWNMASQVVL